MCKFENVDIPIFGNSDIFQNFLANMRPAVNRQPGNRGRDCRAEMRIHFQNQNIPEFLKQFKILKN